MALTQRAFDLLLKHLDPDPRVAGAKYEMTRQKLIKFFEWQRCPDPESCADETLDRVAKRLDEGEEINDLRKYSGGVARLIALEVFKEREKQFRLIQHLTRFASFDTTSQSEEDLTRLQCMSECLRELPKHDRHLITRYSGCKKKEQKKELAEKMGIRLNALRIRIFRIRVQLRECYDNCIRAEA